MADGSENHIVYGRNAVAALLKSGTPVDTVLLADSLDDSSARYFTALAKEAGAVAKRARPDKLQALCQPEPDDERQPSNRQTGANAPRHQGVVAIAAQVAYCEVTDILESARQKNEAPFLLLCDSIEDPHNLGALIRTALLCGVHGVVLPKRGAVGITPAVIKASAGAAAHMPVARVPNLGEVIRRLKKENLFVWCADMAGTPLARQDLCGPMALVVGNEGRGVSPLVKKLCDGAVSLQMAPVAGVDSFNVSVAGGIVLYAAWQQRNQQA